MPLRLAGGIVAGDGAPASGGQIITLTTDDFQTSFGNWSTPGIEQPEDAWSRIVGATPTTSAGPDGGSTPGSRIVDAANGYAYTEASASAESPWSLESRVFDASVGTLTLTFDLHMRFGSLGGLQDGTLQVQGWNGSAWSNIGAAITGSQQATSGANWIASTASGVRDSTSFSNTDFKFRFLATRGQDVFTANYDFCVDNVDVVGPENAIPVVVTPPVLETARGVIYVDAVNGDDNDPGTEEFPKRSISAGVQAALPGFIVNVANGLYRERFTIANKGSNAALPIWIRAENPFQVVMSDLWPEAFDGNVSWRDDGGGVYSAVHSVRPYIGSYTDDAGNERMLFQYNTQSDLRAASITITNVQNTATHNQPNYGFAHDGNRVFIKLRNNADSAFLNPNTDLAPGELKICDSFGRPQITITDSPYILIDGILFEGAGNDAAVSANAASTHLTMRNVKFTYCRHAVRAQDDLLMKYYEYTMPGWLNWALDLLNANTEGLGSIFAMCKSHFSSGGNAFLEGGIAERPISGRPGERATFEFGWNYELFEGHRAGAFNNWILRNERAQFHGDNWIEFEGFRVASPSVNNLAIDCHCEDTHLGSISAQDGAEGRLQGPNYVLRSVIRSTNFTYSHPRNKIKTGRLTSAYSLFCCQNYFENPRGLNIGSSQNLMYQNVSGSNARTDRIQLLNNIIDFPDGIEVQGGTGAPTVGGNALVATADNSTFTANGGSFVGTTSASLGLSAELVPLGGSGVLDIGIALPPQVPDNRGGADPNGDAGPFKLGDSTVLANFPRVAATLFDPDTFISRWTQPGPA